jgi:hypothetical protein
MESQVGMMRDALLVDSSEYRHILVLRPVLVLQGRMENMATMASQPRQRLLYLHARTPNVFSDIVALTLIEPVPGYRAEISAESVEWQYNSVHEAIVDGWQIVQFPHLQAPFDDRDLDVVGYEFILQKMAVIDS